jgi:hypothetical protein
MTTAQIRDLFHDLFPEAVWPGEAMAVENILHDTRQARLNMLAMHHKLTHFETHVSYALGGILDIILSIREKLLHPFRAVPPESHRKANKASS